MKRRSLLLLAPLVISGCGYNRIQTLDEQAAQAKQQIEVQLQRRADAPHRAAIRAAQPSARCRP